MSGSPFVNLNTLDGRAFAVHHSSVLCVEEAKDATSYILVRAGNSTRSFNVKTAYAEVMRLLEKARRAEIMSYEN